MVARKFGFTLLALAAVLAAPAAALAQGTITGRITASETCLLYTSPSPRDS